MLPSIADSYSLRRMRFVPHPIYLTALFALYLAGCGPDGPVRVALFMPPVPERTTATEPALQWVADMVNDAGGIDGRTLVFEDVPYDPTAGNESIVAAAKSLAADDSYMAVIGPGTSETLALVADTFIEHKKPIVSFTSAGAELFRAYGGNGFVWRTRESDIAQTELLVRFAKERSAQRIALVSTLDQNGYSFFSWFGFFAREIGFANDAVAIEALTDPAKCLETVKLAMAAQPNILFVAVSNPNEIECVIQAASPMAGPKPLIVLADTGLDVPRTLEMMGPLAQGVEGMSPVPFSADFEAEYESNTGQELPPHGASEFDSALLLAYGLKFSAGEGGQALVNGLRATVRGRDGTFAANAAGIRGALETIDNDLCPDVTGATGPLDFDPDHDMDLASSEFSHWVWETDKRVYHERYWTGDPEFLTSFGVLVPPDKNGITNLSATSSDYTPSVDKKDVWAVVAALSAGWENYRHQADALRQYQILRKNGVPDDHIILILANDLAKSSKNPLPGQVRNELGGKNLLSNVEIDYDLSISADQLAEIIQGKASAAIPKVVQSTDSSNLYIYLAGHGGETGMTINAKTAADGFYGSDQALFTPKSLRDSLCVLRSENRVRRVFIAVESCYGGVFGDAGYFGIESGCDAGATPLLGVTLLSAANVTEVSFAASYDPSVRAWVGDAFSQRFAATIESAPAGSLTDLYTDVYLGVTGSHVSIYNLSASGKISNIAVNELFGP